MKKWVFRPCCGSLDESLKNKKTFNYLYDMFDYLSNRYCVSIKKFNIELYLDSLDDRCGWHRTYIVCIDSNAIGFCTDCLKMKRKEK